MSSSGLQCRALSMLALVILAPHAAFATRARTSSRMSDAPDGPSDAEPALDKGVSERSNSRLQAVINTLQDLAQSIKEEEETETANYNKYETWCKDELARIDYDIGQKEPALRGANVSEAEKTAAISSTEHAIEAAEKTHGETVQMLAQAKKVRDEEHDKYADDILLNKQSVSQVDQAVKELDKVQITGGFLQEGKMRRAQVNEPGESSIVLGTMKQLKARLLGTASKMTASEDEKVRQYEVIVDSKTGQRQLLETEIIGKKDQITSLKLDNLDNKRALKRLPGEIKDLQSERAEVDTACKEKARAWKVRQEDRAKETKSLNMAIDYLSSNAKTTSVDSSSTNSDDSAPSFLEERSIASDLNTEATHSSYDAAKKAVKELASVLESQQAKEDAIKKRCEGELEQTNAKKSDAEDDLEGLEALIQSKASEALDIQSEVDSLNSEIKAADSALKSAADIRGKEQAAYTSGSKDRRLAIKVLKQSKEVLRMFYKSADRTSSLLAKHHSETKPEQVSAKAPPATWSGSSRKDIGGNAAIGMIEDLIADVKEEQENADVDEQKAADEFAALQQQTQKQFDENMAEITSRAKRKAVLVVEANSHAEDHDGKMNELSGINEQLTALHSECDELLQHYDQRTKARRQELDQLRDAYDILSGSSVAVRTGLMQEVAAVMAAGQQMH